MDVQRIWAAVIKASCAVGTVIIGLLGGWDWPLRALLIMIGLDYAAGLLVAFAGKSPKTERGGLSSSVCFLGLTKKLMVMLILIMAELLDRLAGVQAFRITVICFYAANEGLSIMENAALLELPIPGALKKALEDMKKKKIETGLKREDDQDD